MSVKVSPINVRLPGAHGERFQALRREFPGLPSSVIVRALLTPQLARPLSEQVEIVIGALRSLQPESAGSI